jgi:hypothetical protein
MKVNEKHALFQYANQYNMELATTSGYKKENLIKLINFS